VSVATASRAKALDFVREQFVSRETARGSAASPTKIR
jgi:hypothetical protein